MDFVHPMRAVPLQLVGGRGHYESVIQAVIDARRSVWVATANLKELMVEDTRARPGVRRTTRAKAGGARAYRSILSVFDELVGRGIEVRLLHASVPSGPFRRELARHARLRKPRSGAAAPFELRACPRVHLKVVVVDGEVAYLGSANFTGAGLGAKGEGRRNFELGVVSRDEQLIDELQRLYDEIWSGRPCKGCRLREMCPGPLDEPVPLRRPARAA